MSSTPAAAPSHGGALGKDPTKVDRSAAYVAAIEERRRHGGSPLAANPADAVSIAEPLSVIKWRSTSRYFRDGPAQARPPDAEGTAVPQAQRAGLQETAYGHFGRDPRVTPSRRKDFDLVDALKAY
jgi:hypothetical protein